MTLAEAMAATVSAVASRNAGLATHGARSGTHLDLNLDDVYADLQAIDLALAGQAQRLILAAARQYEAKGKASTPVSTVKKAGHQRLSTGWRLRLMTPYRVHVVNIRPHAHLAAEGWDHVGGKHVPPFVSWIPAAMAVREQMVDQLTQLVQGAGLPRLRALEVTP